MLEKENGEIYLYKRGISGASNAGLEPYCEALASEIVHQADPTSVQYSVLKFHGEAATKCRSFTSEETGFVYNFVCRIAGHGSMGDAVETGQAEQGAEAPEGAGAIQGSASERKYGRNSIYAYRLGGL